MLRPSRMDSSLSEASTPLGTIDSEMQECQRSTSSTYSAGKGALPAKQQLWASERLDMTPLGMVSVLHTEKNKLPWLHTLNSIRNRMIPWQTGCLPSESSC